MTKAKQITNQFPVSYDNWRNAELRASKNGQLLSLTEQALAKEIAKAAVIEKAAISYGEAAQKVNAAMERIRAAEVEWKAASNECWEARKQMAALRDALILARK